MLYIPESDLYRLITHSKLPTAQDFEKWIFEEVLPSICKTGKYQVQPLAFKYYSDKPVLTIRDLCILFNRSVSVLSTSISNLLEEGEDYKCLVTNELRKFKEDNKTPHIISHLIVVFDSGFKKLRKHLNIHPSYKALEYPMKEVQAKSIPVFNVKWRTKKLMDVPENVKAQNKIKEMKNFLISLNFLLDNFKMYNTKEQHEAILKILYITATKFLTEYTNLEKGEYKLIDVSV